MPINGRYLSRKTYLEQFFIIVNQDTGKFSQGSWGDKMFGTIASNNQKEGALIEYHPKVGKTPKIWKGITSVKAHLRLFGIMDIKKLPKPWVLVSKSMEFNYDVWSELNTINTFPANVPISQAECC